MAKDGYGREQPAEVTAFLDELVEVSRRHGFLLSHEDGHGAFVVLSRAGHEELIKPFEAWLRAGAAEDP